MFFYFFLVGLLCALMKINHLLSFLMTLELMGLYFFMMILYLVASHSDFLMVLLYISVMAVESVLGLVMFVNLVRYWSKDYIYLFSLLKF